MGRPFNAPGVPFNRPGLTFNGPAGEPTSYPRIARPLLVIRSVPGSIRARLRPGRIHAPDTRTSIAIRR